MLSKTLTPFQAMDALVHGMSCGSPGESAEAVLKPRVDILESETSFRVEADLPGVDKDSLKVELENGALLIEAERVKPMSEGFKTRRSERLGTARFRRSFQLGDEIEIETISAEFHNGVLILTLPKREKVLPRRIEVS